MTEIRIQPLESNHKKFNIIAIGGQSRSGKTEVVNSIKDLLGQSWHTACRKDLLRFEMASMLTYWIHEPINPDKLDLSVKSTKNLMNHLEYLIEGREPTRLIQSVLSKAILLGNDCILIDSLCYASEVRFFARLKAQLVLVDCSERLPNKKQDVVTALKRYKSTYVIPNNTTRCDLADNVLRFVEFYCHTHDGF